MRAEFLGVGGVGVDEEFEVFSEGEESVERSRNRRASVFQFTRER